MTDLDDFFAKKDKKKSKGKKFTTAEEIVKKLEETDRKTEKCKNENILQSTTSKVREENDTVMQEDDWKNFEAEKKDYTGLKIQNITINEAAENEVCKDSEGGVVESDDGDILPKQNVTGPWKVLQAPALEIPYVSEKDPEEMVKAPLHNSGGTMRCGIYIPPNLRNQPPSVAYSKEEKRPEKKMITASVRSSGGTYIPPNLRNQPSSKAYSSVRSQRARVAPDVNSKAIFPTLSAATSSEPSEAWGRKLVTCTEVYVSPPV